MKLGAGLLGSLVGAFVPYVSVYARVYLTINQAMQVLYPGLILEPVSVELTRAQMKSIKAASKARVRFAKMRVWRAENGGWFIVDQVVGKHEDIDVAVAIDAHGRVSGVEVMTYRESYGHEIINPLWLGQFIGRNYLEHLKLDKQIRNISGATLSCRHVTDAVNRLNHTWQQVLRHHTHHTS